VAALSGLTPFSSQEFCAPQMVAMPVPRNDPKALQAALMERWKIEIPCFDWKDHTVVRVSVQGYNTRDEMDMLVEALSTLLTLERAA
jgi:isopenicillin-N epimerase